MRKPYWWLLVSLTCTTATAGERGDYARQWMLETAQDNAGVYQVELDRDIYRQAHDPALRDIEVFNAQGQSLSAAWLPGKTAPEASPVRKEVPWFALPPVAAGTASDDITLIAERTSDGSVSRIRAHVAGAGSGSPVSPGWLIDTSRVREPIRALHLQWNDEAAPFEQSLRVEASDDLRHWRVLGTQLPWLDLVRQGYRLQQGRIGMDGAQHRYLRLTPSQPAAVPVLSGVEVELGAAVPEQTWQWEILQGQRATDPMGEYIAFEVEGRFPVTRVDVDAGGNDVRRWTLQSRDTQDAPWQIRAGPWVGYQLQAGEQTERSPAQSLRAPVRDRYWCLSSDTPSTTGEVPALRLGYRPETLAFLAQGEPPYALAAGSARAVRADSSLQPMLAALRAERGADWEPAIARTGTAEVLAGDAALVPVVERDWKTWLLWGLLAGGALLVASFAFSLLRQKVPPENA